MMGLSVVRKLRWNLFVARQSAGERLLAYRPLDEIRRLQSRRVRAIVSHAYATVPHYREAMNASGLRPSDFREAADLSHLPLIDGSDLRSRPERFRSTAACGGDGLTIESSGTSGRSKSIRYDARAMFLALAHGGRQRAVQAGLAGRWGGHRELMAVRPESVRVQVQRFYGDRTWVPERVDASRCLVSPSSSFESVLDELGTFRPDVFVGYGSWLGAFFRWASDRGELPHTPRLVVYGADRLEPADRQLIEGRFRLAVLSTYQAVEALRIGFQCELREGFHLSIDHTAVRVVDGAGREVRPGGRGHIVISNLINRATVLLNYRLGDVVTLNERPCACGRTLPTITEIQGRSDDLIRRSDGGAVHGLAILEPLRDVAGVAGVQLVQESEHRLTIRAVGEPGIDRDESAAELRSAGERALGPAMSISVRWVDRLEAGPSGKVRAVISRVGRSAGP